MIKNCLRLCAAAAVILWGSFSDSLWGVPEDDFARKVRNGDHEFLLDIDFNIHQLADAKKFGNGSYYYLGRIYEDLGKKSLAQRLNRLAWESGKEPWSYQAGLVLLEELSETRSFLQSEVIAGMGVARYKNDRYYTRYYLEALYWNKNYTRLLEMLPGYRGMLGFEAGYPIYSQRENTSEALLWEAVGEYRGGRAIREDLFLQHAAEFSASEHHRRIHEFLVDEPDLVGQFNEWELELLRGKRYAAEKRYSEAAQAFERLFEDIRVDTVGDLRPLLTARTVRDIGRAYFYGGYSKTGAKRFSTLDAVVPAASITTLYEWHGRLLARGSRFNEAARVFLRAHDIQGSDTMLWLAFDSAYDHSFAAGQNLVHRYGTQMRNRDYYSDLFESLSADLLHENSWRRLWQLRETVVKYGSEYDRIRFAVIFSEAVASGVTRRPRGVTARDLRSELEYASDQPVSSHYSHLASLMLGKSGANRYRRQAPRRAIPTRYSKNTCVKLIDGYADYHLGALLYTRLRECYNHYETDELIALGRQLHEVGIYDISLRTMDLVRYRNDFTASEQNVLLLYPRAYKNYIEPFAQQNNIHPYFFYATIREESYFKSSVSSHAGAVGLGQFIPSTAREVARRMNIAYPDLTDPESNLMMSSFHLRELLDAVEEQPVFALAGYNAGVSRAKRWQRLNTRYSTLLIHESIPFRETRNYIRKIMVSHIRYAQLYGSESAASVIVQYFPDLQRL